MARAQAEGAGGRPRGGARHWLRGQLRNIAPFITLLALVAFFSLAAGGIGFVGLALGSGFLVQETRLAVVSHQEEAAAAMALAATPKS